MMPPAEFLLPGDRSVMHVLGGTMGALGMETHGPTQWEAWAASLGLPAARKAVVVLLDGLGQEQLAQRSGHFPFLRRRDRTVLTTVSPSTTAAAITAVGTGLPPGLTGMLGYTVREPGTGALLNLIRWDQSYLPMSRWQSRPTAAEQLVARDRFAVVGPGRFIGSGLNMAAFRGGRDISAEKLHERVDATVHALRSDLADLVYLYWGEIDHVGHTCGWNSWQWGEEASATDHELDRLAGALPPGTLLVVTADHGMLDVSERTDAALVPELARGVDLIAGEPRAMQLHTSEDGVAERWSDYLGDRAWVLTREEGLAVIGPTDPRFEPVIGDVVVYMRGTSVVVDSRTQTPGSIALVGVHGSLTRAEMEVPLLVEVI